MRVGIEVGGTFTDLILSDDGGVVRATTKVLSTPENPALAVIQALDEVLAQAGPDLTLLHGSTVATNAVLERRGARTGLLTTSGFGDILDLQRQDRERIYQLQYRKPEPLVPRALVGEIDERIGARGEILQPLAKVQASATINDLIERGVESLAICFLHSYAHPDHEAWIATHIAAQHPQVFVSRSSTVVAEFREYERASTTVIDAFVKPVVQAYLEDLELRAQERAVRSVLMMQSNGGLLPARYVREHPGRTLFSGPAAGVTGALRVAAEAGIADIITMDMGGTSTDVCLVTGGVPEMTTDATIARFPMHVPMLDIQTVGAGGGSIAWLDAGAMLQVGPRSAGAAPGPACYGFGGQEPTTTDANVVRGLVRPGHFLGGALDLDVEAAHRVVSALARDIGQAPGQAAESIARIADVTMANALRLVSTERGYDPRRYTLVAFGGAGPLHAAGVASELNIQRVLIPPYPGLLSAYGLLAGSFQRDFARTHVTPLDEEGFASLPGALDDLRGQAHAETIAFDIDPLACGETLALDLRYRGQGFELTLPVTHAELEDGTAAELAQRFHVYHRQRYGHATPQEPVEIVTLRLSLSQAFETPARLRAPTGKDRQDEQAQILVDGVAVSCRFYWRPSLPEGFLASGPAVIEEPTATTFVPPGWHVHSDAATNLLLEREGTA